MKISDYPQIEFVPKPSLVNAQSKNPDWEKVLQRFKFVVVGR